MPKRNSFISTITVLSLITPFLILVTGCAYYPLTPGHHIAIDRDGRPIGHVKDKFVTLSVGQFEDGYVKPILDGIEEHLRKHRDRPDVLLFVHGGLNGYDDGRQHVVDLLNAQGQAETHPFLSSYYVVAMNWEAGLQSALLDHFFDLRGGIRKRALAITTSPFVFANSVGQGILNMPRDTYYAYGKDLAMDQLPKLGYVGLMAGGAAAVYGGIIAATTNLTFASIIPQAFIVAAGVYVGYLVSTDLTYYGLGPVRMFSAPFIDAFGAPAWEMLKRRPDLTLFNPEIYAEEGVKGPGYILLQAISKRLNRENGTWQTASGEFLPVRLTLVGHSMGAMVGDRILQTFSDRIRFDEVLYMGAASTIADFQLSVIPYLKRYPKTNFWAYSLTEEDESAETLPGDLLMRGSLLEWVDKLFEPPQDLLHYRLGKEKSQEHVIVDDKDVWGQICRITSSGDSKPGVPRKHGDFTDPTMLEHALSFVHHGCPTTVDLNTATREELYHIPYFDENIISKILEYRDKKEFEDKQELVDAHIIPFRNYMCAAEYIAPIDINRATVRQISRLLRGDRFLAAQLVKHAKPIDTGDLLFEPVSVLRDIAHLETVSDLLKNHLPDHDLNDIMGKVTVTSDKYSWRCMHSKQLSGISRIIKDFGDSVREFVLSYPFHDSSRDGRQNDHIKYQHYTFHSQIISALTRSKDASLVSTRPELSKDPMVMEDFWSAVVEIAGKRIGLDIYVRAEFGLTGDFVDWHKDPNLVRKHRIAVTDRAKADQLAAVFSIWDKDISKWPGLQEDEAELKGTLGTTQFVTIFGSPDFITDAILKRVREL